MRARLLRLRFQDRFPLSANAANQTKMQAIRFSEWFAPEEHGVSGNFVCAIFDQDPIAPENRRERDLLLCFNNEYGHEMEVRLSDCVIQTRSVGISVDDLVLEATYAFTASQVTWEPQAFVPMPKAEYFADGDTIKPPEY
jgi:hypothetical protein